MTLCFKKRCGGFSHDSLALILDYPAPLFAFHIGLFSKLYPKLQDAGDWMHPWLLTLTSGIRTSEAPYLQRFSSLRVTSLYSLPFSCSTSAALYHEKYPL